MKVKDLEHKTLHLEIDIDLDEVIIPMILERVSEDYELELDNLIEFIDNGGYLDDYDIKDWTRFIF